MKRRTKMRRGRQKERNYERTATKGIQTNLQIRKCHKQIIADSVITNLNYKYLPLANIDKTINTNNSSDNNNNSNNGKIMNKSGIKKCESSIISILQCKQSNAMSNKHQHYHYRWLLQQHPTIEQLILRYSNKIVNFHKKLIRSKQIKFNLHLVITIVWLACLLPLIQASCRYEPSRSCEAICQPIWSPSIHDNQYQFSNNATAWENTFANNYNCTIRALVLMPDDEGYVASLKRVVPILQVAEQRIHARGLLPSFIHFDWMPQDDKCDAAFAAVKAMDGIVKNCSHVLFGPVCDYSLAAVARIAKYFNSHGTPLISVGGSTFDFEKPKTKCSDEFYMLLRTGMLSFETISELTIAVMKSYKWSRSIFFYDADGQRNVAGQHTCYLMMTSLGKQMRNENMTFAQYRITEKLKNRTEEMTREIGNKNSALLRGSSRG